MQNLAANVQQAVVEFALVFEQCAINVRTRGIDQGARGKQNFHRNYRVVAVEFRTSRHAAGIVRNHTADGGHSAARRIGP